MQLIYCIFLHTQVSFILLDVCFKIIIGVRRLISATQGFTQLQETIQSLVARLDMAELKANDGSEMESAERLDLLQAGSSHF